MGSDNDLVEYRVDDSKWTKMTRIADYDPAYYRYVQDCDYADEVKPVRRPSNPQLCRHLWKATIPSTLPVGEHQIEVRATDSFGRIFTQSSMYKIAALQEYAGKYIFEEGTIIEDVTLTVANDTTVNVTASIGECDLQYLSDETFTFPRYGGTVVFTRNDLNSVQGFAVSIPMAGVENLEARKDDSTPVSRTLYQAYP
jgi:hypothetical protein